MENYIIIAILVVIVAVALLRAGKHFRGGGCCGSGSNTIRLHKSLDGPKLGDKVLTVEGMHCENCEIRLENALNRLDGVAAKVSWRKKTATVSYSTAIPDDTLRTIVERLGYKVTNIK